MLGGAGRARLRPRGRGRRGRLGPALWRRAALAIAVLALLAPVVGCGGGGGDDPGAADPGAADAGATAAADAETLNGVLSRQLSAAAAYAAVIPRLPAPAAALARRLRAQEQEHADAIVKAIRGLGQESDPQVETVGPGELRTRAELLSFLYEMEGATIDYELHAISELEAPWPRALLGSVVANQAQHRYLLRRLLGDGAEAALAGAFEDGTEPPPGAP